MTRSLISDLGKAKGQQLEAQLIAADNAIMLSEVYFGADYAAQLRRSRQSAITKTKNGASGPSPERKLVASALGKR